MPPTVKKKRGFFWGGIKPQCGESWFVNKGDSESCGEELGMPHWGRLRG